MFFCALVCLEQNRDKCPSYVMGCCMDERFNSDKRLSDSWGGEKRAISGEPKEEPEHK